MIIRRLIAKDALCYWKARNAGLKEFPEAFNSSYEEGLALPPEVLAKRFGGADSDDFVLGAFGSSYELAGSVGFQREVREKNRHRGTLIGMYVTPPFRGHGLGKKLALTLIEQARAIEGLEQINLTVTHSNENARRLYLQLGFVPFGIEPRAIKVDGVYYDKEYMALRL